MVFGNVCLFNNTTQKEIIINSLLEQINNLNSHLGLYNVDLCS